MWATIVVGLKFSEQIFQPDHLRPGFCSAANLLGLGRTFQRSHYSRDGGGKPEHGSSQPLEQVRQRLSNQNRGPDRRSQRPIRPVRSCAKRSPLLHWSGVRRSKTQAAQALPGTVVVHHQDGDPGAGFGCCDPTHLIFAIPLMPGQVFLLAVLVGRLALLTVGLPLLLRSLIGSLLCSAYGFRASLITLAGVAPGGFGRLPGPVFLLALLANPVALCPAVPLAAPIRIRSQFCSSAVPALNQALARGCRILAHGFVIGQARFGKDQSRPIRRFGWGVRTFHDEPA